VDESYGELILPRLVVFVQIVVPTWQMDAMVPGQVSMLVMSETGCQQEVGM
jgi:hypothetical protein